MGKIKDIDIMYRRGMSIDEIAEQLGVVKEAIEGLFQADVSVVDKSEDGLYNRAVKSKLRTE